MHAARVDIQIQSIITKYYFRQPGFFIIVSKCSILIQKGVCEVALADFQKFVRGPHYGDLMIPELNWLLLQAR